MIMILLCMGIRLIMQILIGVINFDETDEKAERNDLINDQYTKLNFST